MSKKSAVLCALWLPISAWAGFFVVQEPNSELHSDYAQKKEGIRSNGSQSTRTQSRWVAQAGSTLHESIVAWGQQADWKIYWRAPEVDYPILGDLVYEGSFETAISAIFDAHEKVARPLLVDGNSKQRVLVIRERK